MNIKKIIKLLFYAFILGVMVVLSVNLLIKHQTNPAIYSNEQDIPKTKVAIIFGAGINGNKPSKYLKDRLDAGIKLYKNNKIDKILLSGDNGSDAHDELTVMKLYCYEHGVDTNKIYLDYAGFDSYSTLYRSKFIFDIDTAILVSQKYHLNRCINIGDKLGIKSYGFVADQGTYQGFKYASFREYFAVVKSTIDLMIGRKPHFLGEKVNINGPSNYTKE
ncbi:SanA/YdcF family protein [Pedobacter alluvionis]|uniref:Vancomycin permeability regulator SanA n=1 Tax=Pedobacter alluvionis TaxID=475253 RepID=A0A497XV39_9SPHI|nr:ElyC/SanA/YdcF family protein [Pedobacter alluvionis]RLJ73603.1 vancomycin permeability regulator SanA [Pedobacter alluvionis]